MGDSSNGGGGAADSYIGSLISLTSKSEIRYEGILYTVDTANSNIALQDVRSFGTEGRKKDGPQVPPSDKVYDYIIFRGTDIKDLQVKSSPPIRPPQPQGHHDPAIISVQSQTSPLAPPVAPGGMPVPAASGSQAASSSSTSSDRVNAGPYSGLPAGGYQPSLYPPAGGMGSWAMPQIPPGSNGSMAMPMYWPGYYRPPGGMSHLQQQTPMPFQAPSSLPSNYLTQARLMQQQQQPLTTPASLASTLPVTASGESASLSSSSTLPSSTAAQTSIELSTSSLTVSSISSTVEASSSLDYSGLVKDGNSLEATSVPKVAQCVLDQSASNPQSVPAAVVQSNNLLPSTVSPFTSAVPQDSNKIATVSQSQPSPAPEDMRTEQQLVEEIKSSSSVPQPQVAMNQPLLPLPLNSVRQKQNNQAYHSGNIHPRRGKGRGRGYGAMGSQMHSKFTEDFDFIAMNEKFKKDEVWGELGKSEAREKAETEEDACDDYPHEEEDSSHMGSFQPAYVKDDFFDSLSCDAFERGQGERPKFSEQRKIDTETFGKFSVRFHGGRGGRGGYRGHRGGYYGGRGNGHSGRGRHNSRHNAAF